MKKRILFILLISVVLLPGGRKITPEDIVNLRYVHSPAVDPSGQYIAYVLSVPRDAEEEPGRSYSEIWVGQYRWIKQSTLYLS